MASIARSKRIADRSQTRRPTAKPLGAKSIGATVSISQQRRPVAGNPKSAARNATRPAQGPQRGGTPMARINPRLRPIPLSDNQFPGWLQKLLQVQQGVWVSTIALSVMAMGTYGWSVYSQQQWGEAYHHLDQLRRNERQLISSSEMMKNQIAERVDATSLGLAPQVANDVIFLHPAPPNPAPNPQTSPADATITEAQPASHTTPLGY